MVGASSTDLKFGGLLGREARQFSKIIIKPELLQKRKFRLNYNEPFYAWIKGKTRDPARLVHGECQLLFHEETERLL